LNVSKLRWDLERDRRKKLQRGSISIEQENKAMTEYRIKGAFFENIKDSGPAFTGFVEIDGVKTQMALWPKTSAAGQNYLQVSEDKKAKKIAAPSSGGHSPFKARKLVGNDPPGKPVPYSDGMDDDIPF